MTDQSLELKLLKAIANAMQPTIDDRATVQTRLVPLLEAEELEDLHVTVFWDGGGPGVQNRGMDTEYIAAGIAIQKAVPHAESDERGVTVFGGVDNLPFADEMFALAREVKALWGPDGKLRDTELVGCTFRDVQQENLFEPMHLVTKGVLTVVIDVIYGHTICEEDDEE